MSQQLAKELESFQGAWEGGYYEGDPLEPLSRSTYRQIGFMSVLHATYLRCIKPYITHDTVALEIGPGRGAWTKAMLQAQEVWAIDACSAQDNGFFEYIGDAPNVKYFQVRDFKCEMLPDNRFTYMFSFGCLCHVSFEGITEYAVNLYPKMTLGSNCFWMIADYDKYNMAISNIANYSIWNALLPRYGRFIPLRWLFNRIAKMEAHRKQRPISADKDQEPRPRRWFHSGIERTCSMLQGIGYEIVDPDVGTILRDPMIHFRKP